MSTFPSEPLPSGIDAPAKSDSRHDQFRAWVAWGAASVFLVYQLCIQNSFGSLQDQIKGDLGFDSQTLSFISSIFFITYAGMQVPAGILIDRLGAGWVIPPAIICVGIGSALLSISDSELAATCARLLMGAGGAFSFLGVTAITNRRISSKKIGIATGLTDGAFSAGAIFGAIGVTTLMTVSDMNWRGILMTLAVCSVPIAIINWCALGRGGAVAPRAHYQSSSIFRDFVSVLCNTRILKIGVIYGGFTGVIFGLSGFWNIPLQEAFDRTPQEASMLTTTMFGAMIIGAPIIGSIADRVQRYLPFIGAGCILAVIAIYPSMFISTPSPFWVVSVQFILIGIAMSTGILVFPLACRDIERANAGMASAIVNCMGLMAAGIFQFAPGIIIERTQESGLIALQEGLVIFLIWPIISFCLVLELGWKQHQAHKKLNA